MEKWNGLVAVVTGASSGIGRAIAIRLAKEGMQVAALARRGDRLKELSSEFKGRGKIIPFKCDTSSEEEVVKTFNQIEKTVGPPRVLVNNAAIAPNSRVTDFDLGVANAVFKTNVIGYLSCTKELMKVYNNYPEKQHYVININSILGHTVSNIEGLTYYFCSKHCTTILTRALMWETPNKNINFTSLSPGFVDTELVHQKSWEETFSKFPFLRSEDVAASVITVLSFDSSVVVEELTVRPKGEMA